MSKTERIQNICEWKDTYFNNDVESNIQTNKQRNKSVDFYKNKNSVDLDNRFIKILDWLMYIQFGISKMIKKCVSFGFHKNIQEISQLKNYKNKIVALIEKRNKIRYAKNEHDDIMDALAEYLRNRKVLEEIEKEVNYMIYKSVKILKHHDKRNDNLSLDASRQLELRFSKVKY